MFELRSVYMFSKRWLLTSSSISLVLCLSPDVSFLPLVGGVKVV